MNKNYNSQKKKKEKENDSEKYSPVSTLPEWKNIYLHLIDKLSFKLDKSKYISLDLILHISKNELRMLIVEIM